MTAVRRIAMGLGRAVAILQDLAGLKVRVGEIAGGAVTLETGASFTLTTRQVPGTREEITVPYAHLTRDIQPSDTLLLSDGELELEVVGTTEDAIRCQVTMGGRLAARKGVSLPPRAIAARTFTDKDRDDLAFGLGHGVDYVSVSFVRTAADIREACEMLEEQGGDRVSLIAKIETQAALTNIDEILEVVDGIMVARGDLGVAVPLATVPRWQKMLIGKANGASTATEMLRSMQERPRLTRAEVTDVANVVLDGTDAVMLSGETAIGRFPAEAVMMMAAIAADAESTFPFEAWRQEDEPTGSPPEAVTRAACSLAADIEAAAIITCADSGGTARRVARQRPRAPILAPTSHAETYRRLALVWGVTPLLNPRQATTGALIDGALGAAQATGRVQRGDTVVITAGISGVRAGCVPETPSAGS